MARTADLNSATSQFFINTVDNLRLDDAKYAVFGKVVSGMDVVDKIEASATGDKGGYQNVPLQTVTIKAITLKN
jgi:peptidyl-prolyl cis-trans isomerase A (cyclophilin A)